jgi:hypothetical protein
VERIGIGVADEYPGARIQKSIRRHQPNAIRGGGNEDPQVRMTASVREVSRRMNV